MTGGGITGGPGSSGSGAAPAGPTPKAGKVSPSTAAMITDRWVRAI